MPHVLVVPVSVTQDSLITLEHVQWVNIVFNVINEYSKACVKRSLKNNQNKNLNDKW